LKATLESINQSSEQAFLYRSFSLPKFDAPYHFHPEIELTLILNGKGKRLVGAQINNYEAGDLVLLGENVPHCWLTETQNTEGPITQSNTAQSIVIQFKKDFLGELFLETSVFQKIKILLEKAQTGLVIEGALKVILTEQIKNMAHQNAFDRVMSLLFILNEIANSIEVKNIDNQRFTRKLNPIEAEKFHRAYAYIMENYTAEITLENVAQQAYMTPQAFCRYFKKITRKTLIEVVTEYRINHACQLLISTDKSVNDICFDSGFSNVSYFNKQFKLTKKETPLGYRKLFLT
jgi:AraC-like DNA-binding protein